MKSFYSLILLSFFLVSIEAASQSSHKPKVDSTVFRLGKNSKLVYLKNKAPLQQEAFFKETTDGDIYIGRKTRATRSKKTFFSGIDLGVNMLTQNGDPDMPDNPNWRVEPSKSLYWGINLLKAEIKIIGNQYLLTGFGINYRSFGFNQKQDISVTPDTTVLRPTQLLNPHKNKLRATYLHVPLMLAFNTSETMIKNFHISFGVVGNLRIGSIYKQKYRLNGGYEKSQKRDSFNLSPFLVDGSIRIGFSSITIFANYGLTPLFVEGKAPDMQPITIGLQILGF